MSHSKVLAKAAHSLEESQNQRDARVEQLWRELEPNAAGELDFRGLKKGFRKIDHPMKNADNMLKKILDEVDTNNDGKIQYEEFRAFVQRADDQLFTLFTHIDKDGNGRLNQQSLQAAFRTAGLTVSNKRLDDFFNDMDHNNDGYVTFNEWSRTDFFRKADHLKRLSTSTRRTRETIADNGDPNHRDFLLFMPAREHDSHLKAVLSFYLSVVNVTAEGDSFVSDDTLEGLGTTGSSESLFQSLFGSLVRVAFPFGLRTTPESSGTSPSVASSTKTTTTSDRTGLGAAEVSTSTSTSRKMAPPSSLGSAAPPVAVAGAGAASSRQYQGQKAVAAVAQDAGDSTSTSTHQEISSETQQGAKKKYSLTDFAPDPGYFLAGAIAGGVSRTATAPLDRLKVYLLVNTSEPKNATATAESLKKGRFTSATKSATKPIGTAVREIYRSGGIPGFFAGNGLNVIKIMPETAIKFGSYEAAKRACANFEGHGDPSKISSYSKFTAGGLAGMVAQFCVYPVDTLKFRLQCETVQGGLKGSALVRQTAIKMYSDGGLRACYRGVTMGLVGMFPYSAIDMGMFELLKKTYRRWYATYAGVHEDDANPGNLVTGAIGATSGAIGASVVYPLNVVRTRLQTQGTAMHSATYTGVWDVTQKTIQREGYRGFYKGLTPNLLKVAPALSITWVVYENSKTMLGLS
ncbi:solute carrier family 25 (mitochondrial phosphate transporter), member 23/24/25/41 [Geosmithia morbida]|uniref:Mitochondrial thiamine pyrophosphate carrier 1 n=1 Tax=Geosmithia morbida TaxID=1094350 RepID=A0A9P4YTT1_9HYPO|nr:solute carrier family 25 (mitochondrial phosphate transporter), member 23/24/25/41 [Geosmithia morbida]KAF4121644.1 solute carrier family 25 (mitochondrial phosphate transporter), member 23/24/25/41 [Geosmithia morbida]